MGIAVASGSSYIVTFSGNVVTDDVTPDAGLTVNDENPSYANVIDPTHVEIGTTDEALPGLPWAVVAQPNWLVTAIVSPQSGVTIS